MSQARSTALLDRAVTSQVRTVRAAVYVRISEDGGGEGLGVARQEADCQRLCEAHGWAVTIYSDNDRSAYQRRKQRPAYERLIADIRDGRVDVVVAWHPDRLHRQLRELVPFIDLVNDHGVRVETVKAGVYDLSTSTGRMQAAIAGAVAQHESEHKSDRIRRKLEQNAAEGKHHGGSRPYGWQQDRVTADPDEARVVRYATEQALRGVSMKSLTRDLNAQGFRTSLGHEWRDVTLRTMLLRERNAGIRIRTVGGVTEEAGPGQWEAIVPPEDFRQVQALLKNSSRVTNPGSRGRKHLLSGVAKCGVCGAGMVVGRGKAYKGKSKPIYRCPSAHIIRDQVELDRFITRLVIGRLEMADVRSLMEDNERRTKAGRETARKLQELETRVKDAAEAFAAGSITIAQLTSINTTLLPQIEKLKSEVVSPDRNRVLGELIEAPDVWKVWKGLEPEQRRAVVALLMSITVNRARKGSIFDPKCITVEWKRD